VPYPDGREMSIAPNFLKHLAPCPREDADTVRSQSPPVEKGVRSPDSNVLSVWYALVVALQVVHLATFGICFFVVW